MLDEMGIDLDGIDVDRVLELGTLMERTVGTTAPLRIHFKRPDPEDAPRGIPPAEFGSTEAAAGGTSRTNSA